MLRQYGNLDLHSQKIKETTVRELKKRYEDNWKNDNNIGKKLSG